MAGAVVLDQGALNQLLNGPDGPVGKELARRSIQVHRAAMQLCPVDIGRLRTSITWRVGVDSQGLAGIVGTDVEYAMAVEFGATIVPKRAQFLHFFVGGQEVFTKGPVVQPPRPFLRPALAAAG